MLIAETDRLQLRRLVISDDAFILKLLNEPSWKAFIGDKHVETLADARQYLQANPITMYERYGFGLFLVSLKEGQIPIGVCGLIKREGLADVDLGFAFLPEYWGKGYAKEAANSVIAYAKSTVGLAQLAAITLSHNKASIALLQSLGFVYDKAIQLSPNAELLELFKIKLY